MSKHHRYTACCRPRRSLRQAAVTGGLVALVVAGCAQTGTEPTPATPPPSGGVAGSAEAVATEALARIFTWHPAREEPGASLATARELLGPTLLRVLDTPPGPAAATVARTSLQWAAWQAAEARVEAFTFASAEPSGDTDPAVAHRKIGLEQTVVYPDGRREPLTPTAVVATLVATPAGWRLDGYQ